MFLNNILKIFRLLSPLENFVGWEALFSKGKKGGFEGNLSVSDLAFWFLYGCKDWFFFATFF